jgi:hypothetical protein
MFRMAGDWRRILFLLCKNMFAYFLYSVIDCLIRNQFVPGAVDFNRL